MIRFAPPLLPAVFLARENRFRANVAVDGQPVAAHIANSGRLRELLLPGARCYVSEAPGEARKTHYDLKVIELGYALVCIDAHLTNAIFADTFASRTFLSFSRYVAIQPEVQRGESRLDFRLSTPGGPSMWVETKSVTLVRDGVARFPDAPTQRGTRHLDELADAARSGEGAAVVFVIQRPDAVRLEPNVVTDPAFSQALIRAAQAGVGVHAMICDVTIEGIEILREVPVRLVPHEDLQCSRV